GRAMIPPAPLYFPVRPGPRGALRPSGRCPRSRGARWRRARMADPNRPPSRLPTPRTRAMTDELHTIIDLIRYGASRFQAAGLTFGHSYDNAIDEATQLTLHALHLPHDLGP